MQEVAYIQNFTSNQLQGFNSHYISSTTTSLGKTWKDFGLEADQEQDLQCRSPILPDFSDLITSLSTTDQPRP